MTETAAGRRSATRLARLAFVDGARAAELLAVGPLRLVGRRSTNAPADDAAAAVVAAIGRTADPDAALAALAELAAAPGGADAARRARSQPGAARPAAAAARRLVRARRAPGRESRGVAGARRRGDLTGMARPARRGGRRRCRPPGGRDGRHAGRRSPDRTRSPRCAPPTGASWSRSPGATCPASWICARSPARWPTSPATRCRPRSRSPRPSLPDDAAPCRLAIIAMGKTGGRELNYVSDVDVIFVAEPGESDGAEVDPDRALRTATTLAGDTMRICRAVAWEVDAALRPEGKDGPLVRTLASHEAYYERWASTWEFQALLKARPVAGDLELGAALRWTSSARWCGPRPSARTSSPTCGRCAAGSSRTSRRRSADREIKLGPRRAARRRVRGAAAATRARPRRRDRCGSAATLPGAGRAARRRLRRPRRRASASPTPTRSCARPSTGCSCAGCAAPTSCPTTRPTLALARARDGLPPGRARRRPRGLARRSGRCTRARCAACTRSCSTGRCSRRWRGCPSAGLRLTAGEAGRRLAALGFADPTRRAAAHRGADRRAVAPRHAAAHAAAGHAVGLRRRPRPGRRAARLPAGVRRARRARRGTCGCCATRAQVASRLAYLLGTSRYVAGMLGRAPEALQHARRRRRAARRAASRESHAAMRRQRATPGRPGRGGGRRARRAPPRAAAHRLRRPARPDRRRRRSARRSARRPRRRSRPRCRSPCARSPPSAGSTSCRCGFAVIAMGRLGGAEIGYGSDADVMFVYEPVGDRPTPTQPRIAQDVAERLRALLSAPSSTDPPLGVDADLRPEGRNGPLVRSLASYAQYYARWSSAWEAQALLRARFAVGDADLGGRFIALIDPVRYPAGGRRARPTWSRSAGSRGASTPSGCRAAPTRRRTPSSAAAASPTSSGRSSCCSLRTRARVAGTAHDPHPRRAARGRGGRAARARAGRRAGDRLAAGHPAPQRDHAGPRQGRGPDAARKAPRCVAVGRALGYPAGLRSRAASSTTTAAPPGGRGGSSRTSSTAAG